MRHGAQTAHDAADAERVRDRLPQAEPLGDLEIGDGAGIVAADLERDDDEIGALERAALVASGFRSRAGTPSVATSLPATTALSSSRCGSMSISAIFDPASAGRCSTSPTMFFMNTVEPAPMKAILGKDISEVRGSGLPLPLREKVARSAG